jgi:thiol-disulfide isomerase/thioredoxin
MRFCALLLLLLLAACREQPAAAPDANAAAPAPAGEADRSRRGTPAPATQFEDPDGELATLADFRGKPLLLNLWATWCAPCVAEMPTLDRLAFREGDRLQVLTVSEDLDGREKVEAFLAERRFRELDSWLDPKMELMAALGVSTLPTTILFDGEGREVWRVTGGEDWTGEEARALLAEAAHSVIPAKAGISGRQGYGG